MGRVLVCHDISELVRARTEVERQLHLVDQLRGELLEQTLQDPMTGAYNRR
ncbi:hypothetical protein [uncultured Jatrophihabitans sp.]|uniref:hypothetical protein n=1 Tax=uncultured Jatrophihabitans sp. TaxID=1610747 RepID=UPI0035CB149D